MTGREITQAARLWIRPLAVGSLFLLSVRLASADTASDSASLLNEQQPEAPATVNEDQALAPSTEPDAGAAEEAEVDAPEAKEEASQAEVSKGPDTPIQEPKQGGTVQQEGAASAPGAVDRGPLIAPDVLPAEGVSPAEGLGHGSVLVGLERIAGVYAWRSSIEDDSPGAGRVELNGFMANAALANTSTNSPEGVINVFAAPRLALDGVLAKAITVGGSIGYISATGKRKDLNEEGQQAATSFPDGSALLLSLRFGYLRAFSDAVAVWPRVSGSFVRLSDKAPELETTATFLNLSIEPMLVLVPFSHFGVVLGPVIDIPVGGTFETVERQGEATTGDTSFANYGASAGVVAGF